KNYQDTPTIRAAPLGIRTKLFLAFENRLPVFFDIQQRFQEIFPHVEAIKVVPFFFDEQAKTFIETHLSIQLKEQGVANWISQSNISAGMLRALFHLADLYLISDGSVLLMDEFENSLGVNCIDELVSDMLVSSRQLQYILTSHHPYIINTIPFTNWKLVTRKAGVVKTHDPSRWDFGRSKHDAFMQLMQLEEFQTGREMSLPG
ncbi:MAG: AAA family ATPase, partial [Bacteroidota bacterium]